MAAGKKTSQAVDQKLSELAQRVGAMRRELGVLLFTLDEALPQSLVAEHLGEQFAWLQLDSRIVSAGPQRVQAVLDGKFDQIDVLVVLGRAGSQGEDELMELVEWLLANGREHLAQSLVYAQVGHAGTRRGAEAFTRVHLTRTYTSPKRTGGLRLPWTAGSYDSWELAEAVLDYAAGLGAE